MGKLKAATAVCTISGEAGTETYYFSFHPSFNATQEELTGTVEVYQYQAAT